MDHVVNPRIMGLIFFLENNKLWKEWSASGRSRTFQSPERSHKGFPTFNYILLGQDPALCLESRVAWRFGVMNNHSLIPSWIARCKKLNYSWALRSFLRLPRFIIICINAILFIHILIFCTSFWSFWIFLSGTRFLVTETFFWRV